MDSIIKMEEVWKVYKLGETNVPALRGVNLEVKKGEFLGVLGPSGSGKSTFLNMVGCLDIPTSGKVFLEKKDISTLSENYLSNLRGKKIGFIFQQFNLLKNLTALENVTIPMTFLGVNKGERENTAKNILNRVGLEKRFQHRPRELSGGERQRVAIARALANNPDIIVADEPTGNLDSKTGKIILDIISDLHNEGKTIILVTHDKEMAGYAKRVVNLKDGKIL